MDTCPGTLTVRSFTEAQLYIWVTRCGQCGNGPLVPEIGRADGPQAAPTAVPVVCRSCGAASELRFDGDWAAGSGEVSLATLDLCLVPPGLPINPTDEPSRVIDVAGWLTLESMLAEKARQAAGGADNAADRVVVRQWQLLAGACVEEALKFYEEDNELPPAEAFFDEGSRGQFRERPAMFTRGRLIELRARRPVRAGE